MKKSSLQAVIASKENRCLLLFLGEGPKDLNNLMVSLGTTREQSLSIIRSLEESYLITGNSGIYRLTCMGELIVWKLKPLFSLEELINTANGYWLNRKLDFIPSFLLKELHKVTSGTVIQPSSSDLYDYNKEAHEASLSSKSFNMAAAGLHPVFPDLFSDMIDSGVNLSLIFDPYLLDKMKRDNPDELQKLLNERQVSIHLYSQQMPFLSFKVNDLCIVLKLLDRNNVYDHKQLICYGPDAVEWGKELFEHYLRQSVQIADPEQF
jgi:predicted transcriptional regulator